MTSIKVTGFVAVSSPMVIQLHDVDFYVDNNSGTPRLGLKASIVSITDTLQFTQFPGIPKDAWFKTVLKENITYLNSGTSFKAKVGWLLDCIGSETPEQDVSLAEGLEMAAAEIRAFIEKRGKGAVLVVSGTTTLGTPYFVENETTGQRFMRSGTRYLNIIEFDPEGSAWVQGLMS